MEYKYQYQVQPSDLWQLQMYYTYSSYLAMINVIFILSSAALLYALWGNAPWWLRILLLFFLSRYYSSTSNGISKILDIVFSSFSPK